MADPSGSSEVDRALITRVLLTQDRRAFEQLMRRHQGMVRAQLRRLVQGDHARADDLAQETFLQAWRKLDQFRGQARFSTWLYRIAYSRFLLARRKGDGAMEAGEDALPDTAHPAADTAHLRIDIERAMRRLSEPEQTVLLHTAQLGLSHEEAAYVLAMPLGTVKSHARRGKERLRAALADWAAPSHKEQEL